MPGNTSIEKDVAAVGRLRAVPRILEAVARSTGMRFTAVARVTDTSWTACAVYDQIEFGLKPGGELVLETTICNEIRQHQRPVVFGQASTHPEFRTHPTPKLYGFESYVSIPIFREDGSFWGTLCAIDPLPAKLDDPNIVRTLELFAQLIASQLEADERLRQTGEALVDANETAQLRERFIAVLGHDLRNPLGAITMGVAALEMTISDTRALGTLASIRRSAVRMTDMVREILDFARARLAGGIDAALQIDDGLPAELSHVIAEVAAANAAKKIDSSFALDHPVRCDRRRLGQLLGNLLMNAVTHGAAGQPIQVKARSNAQEFDLSVTSGGTIGEDIIDQLFRPFSGSAMPGTGLGLGLYIAAEIAKSHGGTLTAFSDTASTTFRFVLPAT